MRRAGLVALTVLVVAAVAASIQGDDTERAPDPSARPAETIRVPVGRDATGRVPPTAPIGRLALAARGVRCSSPPLVTVFVDGEPRFRSYVGAEWLEIGATAPMPARAHDVRVSVRGIDRACEVEMWRTVRAERRAIQLGAAIRHDRLELPGYTRTFTGHFDSLTPENEMKMFVTQPERGEFRFEQADRLVAYADQRSRRVRGHALVYDLQLPPWMQRPAGAWTRDELIGVMREHIRTLVSRYRGRVESWDVVNEPFEPDGSLTRSVWHRVIGPSYIELALRFAREADPDARLFLNEMGAETPGPKAEAMLSLARDLRRRGVPLDGVGLQNHTDSTTYPRAPVLEETMRRYAALGLDVEITEMDVVQGPRTEAPSRHAREQRRAYLEAGRACEAVAACKRITTWGMSDATSWLTPARLPLLFDTRFRPKRAFGELVLGLAGRGGAGGDPLPGAALTVQPKRPRD